MPMILQEWVTNLELYNQEIIISIIRKPDIRRGLKNFGIDPKLRNLLLKSILIPYDGCTYHDINVDFKKWQEEETKFLKYWPVYSRSFVVHFVRAIRIIGRFGSKEYPIFSDRWLHLYDAISYAMTSPKATNLGVSLPLTKMFKRSDEDEVIYRIAYENDDKETMKQLDEKYTHIDREKRRKQNAFRIPRQ